MPFQRAILAAIGRVGVALALCLVGSPSLGAAFTGAQTAAIDKVVADALAVSDAPSASVAVVRDGKIVFAKAYGSRRIAPEAVASADTRYRIASVSKQFTAAAVLMLADSGKLSLDDEVSHYLPELGGGDHGTIRQALSHTAGYREFWTVDYVPPQIQQPTSPKAIVERWGAAAPDFPPGSKWAYSNTGYMVLGRLVETVSGQPLGVFLHDRIFAPLHMTSAEDVDGRVMDAADATGYARYAAGPPRLAQLPAGGWTEGCGELAMTASDLARWDISFVDQSLMSKTAYAEQASEAKLKDGSATGYGFGVFLDTVRDHRRVRHNGDLPGFWSENRIYPDDRAAIVVLMNGSYGGSPHAVIANGIEALLFPDPQGVKPRPTAYQTLRKLYGQIGSGALDRGLLTANANEYLAGQVLADYQTSFADLGEPDGFLSIRSEEGGGLTGNTWLAVWPTVKMLVTLRTRPDGKVDEFVAVPVDKTPRHPGETPSH